jgi:UDP-glucose 4-epimerase/UDP-glucuronate decarboxylase
MENGSSQANSALVTGGAGFIGMHVARALVERGVAVTLVDDMSRGRRDDGLDDLLKHASLVEHDLTEPLPDSISSRRFDAVFHFAALVGVRNVSRAPEAVLRVNVGSTINLLDWCAEQPPGAFFLSSTSEVADGARSPDGSGSEDGSFVVAEPLAPRASYAVSKLTSELLVAHYGERHGFRSRIGRYHNVYGPRMGYDHVIPELMVRAHGGVDPFPVWAVDHSRAFCYVADAVDATLDVMALDDPAHLVVNIGDDSEEIRIGRLAERVLRLAGHDGCIEPRPAPPGSPVRRRPDLRRLRQLIGGQAHTSLEEGLARTWEWYAAELERSGAAS